MKRREISNCTSLKPLKIPARQIPHAVIEPNFTCNGRCAVCYNQYRDVVKPLDQVFSEIDLALRKRNLETISILGGEPTLHPHLPLMVRYVESKKLVCQVLTNGIVFLHDREDTLLKRLVEEGIDRLIFHVDPGQGIDQEEANAMREALGRKCEDRRVSFGLSVTLYTDNPESVPEIMKRFAHFRYFDGILVTIARPTDLGHSSPEQAEYGSGLGAVYRSIRTGLGIEPVTFVPSSLDDNEVRWLIYFYYINSLTGATVSLAPWVSRWMRAVYRLVTRKHLFAATSRPSYVLIWMVVTFLMQLLSGTSRLSHFVRLWRNSDHLSALRFHYIVVQRAPVVDSGSNRVEICYHCPDATIRNGKLAPVCLADDISPPRTRNVDLPSKEQVARAVYAHLEEE